MVKFLLLIVLIVLMVVIARRRKGKSTVAPAAEKVRSLLEAHVAFFKRLPKEEQDSFTKRVQHFLATVRITPVGSVKITELDKIYVAAAAIIPIHHFPDWAYNNLDEVLIYPQHFNPDYQSNTSDAYVMGMVGDGAMHRMMILSLPALRAGFAPQATKNTALHEFVHLLDKADGATDGIPELMLPKQLVSPWIAQMHYSIKEIRKTGGEDIDAYAGVNETEFFAVLSEYFFQRPKELAAEHPKFFELLATIYGYQQQQKKHNGLIIACNNFD